MLCQLLNIITHFIPCLCAFGLTLFQDTWLMALYTSSMSLCFGTSTIYHLALYCECETDLLTADKLGILILMWTSNIPIILMHFSSEWAFFYGVFTTIWVLRTALMTGMTSEHFVALATFGWIEALHINRPEVYDIFLSTFSFYIVGFVFYQQDALHAAWHICTAIGAFVHYHNLKQLCTNQTSYSLE